MTLDELERNLIRTAQNELAPSAADRERNQAELFARLGGGGAWGGTGLPPGALLREVLSGGPLSRAAILHTAGAVRSSRFGMLGLGLIVGAMVGGWFGFGLGQSGSRDPREHAREGSETPPSPPPTVASDADPASLGQSEAAPPFSPGAGAASAEDTPPGAAVLPGETQSRPLDPGGGARRSGPSGAHAAARGKASADEPSSLAAELAMLQRARRALNADNGRLALGIVQDLDEQFPRGILIEERSATRILSLCQLERLGEARQVARAFLEQYPVSVYAERVRGSCITDPEE